MDTDSQEPTTDECSRCNRTARVYLVRDEWICVVCHDWLDEFDSEPTGLADGSQTRLGDAY